MEFILIRHALPERIENTFGPADPALTEIGREQANRLANWLAAEPIQHILSSPKARARQTAEPLAQKLQLGIEIIPEFSEIDRSSSQYIPVEELRRENHEIYQKIKNRQWADLGYLDPDAFRSEVVAAFETIVGRYNEGDCVAIVAHGGTLNAIASHVIGLESMFFAHPEYTSISRLSTNDWNNSLRLATFNETAHLHAARDVLDPLYY